MLHGCGLEDFLPRRVHELLAFDHQFIIAQSIGNIVVILINAVSAISGEFFPKRVSYIRLEIECSAYGVDLSCENRLRTVDKQTALLIERTGYTADFRLAYCELRLDRGHLGLVWEIHVLI